MGVGVTRWQGVGVIVPLTPCHRERSEPLPITHHPLLGRAHCGDGGVDRGFGGLGDEDGSR
jgi:hypothetical protein